MIFCVHALDAAALMNNHEWKTKINNNSEIDALNVF